ncbi:hypothetical protein M0813_15692 [Anaeramoeba flamelloides]|uniref:Uncharacterized protein n=1 Tax=Anaeramoeba flamelloides TaxID=1746091 RepID=A0ABQ8Z253_9EUKA|nr:hypothetical protein M0813_15692 [Anaeramoeba flamelloides]
MKLAKVYLLGLHIERSISLLEDLLKRRGLPQSKKPQILELLIEAYLKKGWLKEAWITAEKYEKEETKNNRKTFRQFRQSSLNPELEKKRLERAKKFKLSSFMVKRESNNFSNLKTHLKFVEYLCKLSYLRGKFGDAIYWVNCLLRLISESNLGSHGRYLYIKGKILQKLCNPKIIHQFPLIISLTFDPNKETKFGEALPLPKYNMKTYPTLGDVINECVQIFLESIDYFEKAGNLYKKSKALNRLVETLLEFVFPLVGLLGYDLSQVGKLPDYEEQLNLSPYQNNKNQNNKNKNKIHLNNMYRSKSSQLTLEITKSFKDIGGKDIDTSSMKSDSTSTFSSPLSNSSSLSDFEMNNDVDFNQLKNQNSNSNYGNSKNKNKNKKGNQKANSFSDSNNKKSHRYYFAPIKGDNEKKYISLKNVEKSANEAIEIISKISDPLLLLNCYLNFAELKYLQGNTDHSKIYFEECKNGFFKLFMSTTSCLFSKETPYSFLLKLFNILKRLVRFLFVLDKKMISQNLFLIESYLSFERLVEISMGKKINLNEKNNFELDNKEKQKKLEEKIMKRNKKLIKEIIKANDRENKEKGNGQKNYRDSDFKDNRIKVNALLRLNGGIKNNKGKTDYLVGDKDKNKENSGKYQERIENYFNQLLKNYQYETNFFNKKNYKKKVSNCSEKIWSLLHRIKLNISNQIDDIQNSDLFDQNKKLLKKIEKTTKNFRFKEKIYQKYFQKCLQKNLKVKKDGINHTSLYFNTIQKFSKISYKLIYTLLIDDILIIYIPSIQFSKIFTLGGMRFTQILNESGLQKELTHSRFGAFFSPTKQEHLMDFFIGLSNKLSRDKKTDSNKNYTKINRNYTKGNAWGGGNHMSRDRGWRGSRGNQRGCDDVNNFTKNAKRHKNNIKKLKILNSWDKKINFSMSNSPISRRSSLPNQLTKSKSRSSLEIRNSIMNSDLNTFTRIKNFSCMNWEKLFNSVNKFSKNQALFQKILSKHYYLSSREEEFINSWILQHQENPKRQIKKLNTSFNHLNFFDPLFSNNPFFLKINNNSNRNRNHSIKINKATGSLNNVDMKKNVKDKHGQKPSISNYHTNRLSKSNNTINKKKYIKPTKKIQPFQKMFSKYCRKNKIEMKSDHPIILISSKWLQIFPWDKIFNDNLIRCFSLLDLLFLPKLKPESQVKAKASNNNARNINSKSIEKETKRKTKSAEGSKSKIKINTKIINKKDIERPMMLPHYFAFNSSPEFAKEIIKQELQKKKNVSKKIMFQLNHSVELFLSGKEMQNSPPFHSPLLKFGNLSGKGLKKFITFFENRLFMNNPKLLIYLINLSLKKNHFPVFLISMIDFLDMSQIIYYLISKNLYFTFLVAKESKMFEIVKLLKRAQDGYLFNIKNKKTPKTPYQFLTITVKTIRQVLNTNIYIYSPPNPNQNIIDFY